MPLLVSLTSQMRHFILPLIGRKLDGKSGQLNRIIVFNESSLRRILASYFVYYHLSMGKDSPETRPVQPPEIGLVVAVRQAGGLQHRYERAAQRRPGLPRNSA